MPRASRRGADDVERPRAAAARAEHRRDGGRHRTERRRRLHGARVVDNLARYTGAAGAACGEPVPRHAEHGRRARRTRARCGAWPSKSARSRATCGCSAWDRAPGSSEIALPAVQPGSSIMPGKVNPSVPEMVNQVCFQVMGCDATVADGGRSRTARAERDDAGHRLERAARDPHPARGDDACCAIAASTGSTADAGALPRAARSQHGDGDRAQPVHRLRGNRRDREEGSEAPASRFASWCASAACCPTTSSIGSFRRRR